MRWWEDMATPARADKIATIRDVAMQSGVSIATVSRVLNARPGVRPETRERVQSAVKRLGFQPSIQARGMRGRSPLIGLVIHDNLHAYVSEVQAGVAARCRERGLHMVVTAAGMNAPAAIEAVQEMNAALRVSGVILIPPLSDYPELLDAVRDAGIVCARLSAAPTPDIATVHLDETAAAKAMVSRLLSLGHRRIGLIAGPPDRRVSSMRRAGYLAALAEARIAPEDRLMVQTGFDFAAGAAAARTLIEQPDRPTAIFASNDDMALGAMSAARAAGLRIPRDISIAGYDDVPAANLVWPRLSTLHQPIRDMAGAAVDMIAARLTPGPGGATVSHRRFDFQVMMRGSVAAPSARDISAGAHLGFQNA